MNRHDRRAAKRQGCLAALLYAYGLILPAVAAVAARLVRLVGGLFRRRQARTPAPPAPAPLPVIPPRPAPVATAARRARARILACPPNGPGRNRFTTGRPAKIGP
jgi:hypothetical protein